jgi:hypothetical protein
MGPYRLEGVSRALMTGELGADTMSWAHFAVSPCARKARQAIKIGVAVRQHVDLLTGGKSDEMVDADLLIAATWLFTGTNW